MPTNRQWWKPICRDWGCASLGRPVALSMQQVEPGSRSGLMSQADPIHPRGRAELNVLGWAPDCGSKSKSGKRPTRPAPTSWQCSRRNQTRRCRYELIQGQRSACTPYVRITSVHSVLRMYCPEKYSVMQRVQAPKERVGKTRHSRSR